MNFPEAGGSSSFARHAFNELVSFGAAWAQMLNYVITIAISAFFVPHYLSIFWEPLRTNPWDIVFGIVVVVLLVGINIVGVQEAAALNVLLAVVDFATQLLLVLLGFFLIFSPHTLRSERPLGHRADLGELRARDPGGDDRLHRDRDRLEPGRGGARPAPEHPGVDPARRDRRLRDLLHAAAVALSALPVYMAAAGEYVTQLGLDPPQRLQERPRARTGREPEPARALLLDAPKVYVGVLAATILFIAANAGVIGASRITYSMSSYRQLPEVFRRLHPRFKTPWLAADRLRRRLLVPVHAPGERRLHRPDVRVRRDALVHDRALRR